MIRSFSCKNFYSFADESLVSFVVDKKAPDKEYYFKSSTGDRLSKILTVIGPNASGKTNLLKVLPFLKWLILDSFSLNPKSKLPVKPFLFHTFEKKPIELSVEFEIGGDIYFYLFALDESKILREELKIKNITKQKLTTKTLFIRKWNKKDEKYDFDDKNFNLSKDFENALRTNTSVLSTAIRLNHEKSRLIGEFWQKVETNVVEAGWLGDHLYQNNQMFLGTLDFFSDNNKLKEEAETLLKRFDIGLESFDIKKEKKENKENEFSINAKVVHSFGGMKYGLPIHYESSGTRQLFILLKTILQVLAEGGIAVLDEFDVNLHPEMISALFELFVSPETNLKNSQMIFSTHSHRILSDLDKHQIILVEKNEKGSSEAWRLDEMAGVRADDNYYAKYMAGAYGAVPTIS